MVEEEELSYQIDAAATAARLHQEELQRRLLLDSAAENSCKLRHNYKTFPGQREQLLITPRDDDSDVHRQICRDLCCRNSGSNSKHSGQSRTSSGHHTSSSSPVPITNDDDDDDDPEDQKQRLRELQQVERELAILGLQRYQDASTESVLLPPSPQDQSPPEGHHRQYDSRRESFQESEVDWVPEQALQFEQAKSSSQVQPQRRQRQRRNSLAYEERRADLDTLRAQVKSETATKVTQVSTSTTPLLDFHDGLREEHSESDDDDDDDAVVLSVARRVSVCLHAQSHHDWSTFLGQDRQRPSYDVERARGRGASWAPPPRTTTLANAKRHSRMASMSEVKTDTTTSTPAMVSAR